MSPINCPNLQFYHINPFFISPFHFHNAIFFIAQHLALVISASNIVHNMHEAYERLSFDSPGFGAFISGPSKTADIEQSLVVGAHGPRSLTVFVTA